MGGQVLLLVALLLLAGRAAGSGTEGSVSPPMPDWFHDSFLILPEEVEAAAEEGKRVLLYFHQNGCPYCRRLLVENFGDPKIAARTQALYRVIEINLWGDREVELAEGLLTTEKRYAASLKVMFTPTLVVLDEGGREAFRMNGYYPPQRFLHALDYGSGRHPAGQTFGEYVEEIATSPAIGPEPSPKRAQTGDEGFLQPPYLLNRGTIPAERPLLVIYEGEPCPACGEMREQLRHDPALRRALQQFDVVRLNRHSDTPLLTPSGERSTARAWAVTLKIPYTPALIFFDRSGSEVFRVEAFLWSFHLHTALAYVAEGAYRTEPSFQRFVHARADRLREQGVEVRMTD